MIIGGRNISMTKIWIDKVESIEWVTISFDIRGSIYYLFICTKIHEKLNESPFTSLIDYGKMLCMILSKISHEVTSWRNNTRIDNLV